MAPNKSGFMASLDQLTGALSAANSGGRFRSVPTTTVHPDPEQPRTEFGGEEDDSLAASIARSGIVQPIVVQPHPELANEFLIVAGERRFRSAQAAGLTEVPIVLRDQLDPGDALLLQLVENDQRRALSLLETARGLQRLMSLKGWSQTEVAHELGRSTSWVNRHLALLEQTGHVSDALERGALQSLETARLYTQLPEEAQAELLTEAVAEEVPIPRGKVERALKLVPTDAVPSAAASSSAASRPRRGRPRKERPAAPESDPSQLYPLQLTWAEILTLFSRLDVETDPTPDSYASQLRSLLKT